MTRRQTYTLDEIKDMLLARIEDVVHRYAPPAKDCHITRGVYFTLNPGRADRSVGSFAIRMTGSRAGTWNDYATGQFGDILDLVGLAIGRDDPRDQLREARAFLGLSTADPGEIARQKARAEELKLHRAALAVEEKKEVERNRRRAVGLWLSGQERLRGTPVEAYLRGARGIDLAALGRQPGALRYLSACRYYHEDDETGEIFEGEYPAMVGIVVDPRGRPVACHRHYLALGQDGRWGKAPVPAPKKAWGEYAGCAIHLWKGLGPRGGKPPSLRHAPAGTHVFVVEGIEDGLSVVQLMPEARVLVAISLSNMGALVLPDCVSEVTLVADRDENDQARAQLSRAIAAHRRAGRTVRLWQNRHGGKDMNDALRAAVEAARGEEGRGAA